MKIVAVICNVVYWAFLCLVMVTDGPPKGADIFWSLIAFVMPILNVVVIRVLSSPSRVMRLAAFAGNIVWLGLACWLLIARFPSHPAEGGLVEFAVLTALTPLLSAIAIYPSIRTAKPALAK